MGDNVLDRILDLAKINNVITNFSEEARKQYYHYLIHDFGVLFTYHSNRIEGTNLTLTLNDTKNILNHTFDIKSIEDKEKQREIKETINHQKAFQYIFDILDQDLDIITIICNLHRIVGAGIIKNAGSYKKNENYLINSDGKEIDFTKPEDVESRMNELRNKFETEWKSLTAFEQATNIHMSIINIHPFADANGRVARLVLNYILIKNNYPPININESLKLSYYSLIEEININTDYLNEPMQFGDTRLFYETIQQLSINTFKNLEKFIDRK